MLIAISRVDGGVSLLRTIGENVSIEEEIGKWQGAHPGAYLAHTEAKESDVPSDRTFRNAWKGDLSVDMGKARDIWKDKMRAVRAPKLAALDTEYMRADETGDAQAKSAVAAQKQELRDVTADPGIEAAQTPQDLKAVWPECLD
jgi:hypothetical protein